MENTFTHTLQETVLNDPLLLSIFGATFILLVLVIYLLLRINALTKGAAGASLEKVINENQKRISDLEEHCLREAKKVTHIDTRLKTSLRGVALERFDPYQNAGGQQSFSSALINEHGNGIAVSGIHSRDGVRVYAKEIENFVSKIELSEEEARAVKKAKESL